MSDLEQHKQRAAERALEYVKNGMVLGLGSGSTARYMLIGLAQRLGDGRLRDIAGVPTSETVAALARQIGIPLTTLEEHPLLDLAIDGADEIDPALNLIKGLGGALLREKIVAASARRLIIVADESKLVQQLGTRAPLPVEVIPFALPLCTRLLSELGCTPALRQTPDRVPFQTDEGNVILDCHFSGILDPAVLGATLDAIPGIVEHGLFLGIAVVALVAGPSGVRTLLRPA